MAGVLAVSRRVTREPDRVGDGVRVALIGLVGAMLLGLFVYASAATGGGGGEDVPAALLVSP